jgi:hypothetical protein
LARAQTALAIRTLTGVCGYEAAPAPVIGRTWPPRIRGFVVDLVLFAGPVIANGVSQPKPAVSRIAGGRLKFDRKLVIVEPKRHLAADIRARLDRPRSHHRIDVEPQRALNRRPSALSSATITAHCSGPDFPKLIG